MEKQKLPVMCFVDNNFDNERFLKLRMRVCHDGLCPNNVFITKETMEAANATIEYIPILANTVYDNDGVPQIGAHDMHIEEDKLNPGEARLFYDEVPVGVIPAASENNCTIEEYEGRNYTYVDAYVWRKYSNYIADILEAQDETKISMEISIPDDKLSYNAKENYAIIEEYVYDGVTLLNNKYGTGMKDAMTEVVTFTADDSKTEMRNIMAELKNVLATFEEEEKVQDEEIIEDEIVEPEISETFGDGATEEEVTPNVPDPATPIEVGDGDSTNGETEAEENEWTPAMDDDEKKQPSMYTKTFELSFDEIYNGLYALLSAVEEEDGEWYYIDQCYNNRFDYVGMLHGKIYRQGYKRQGDSVKFDGDRVEMYDIRCTEAERDYINTMRETYAEMVTELNQYREKERIEQEQAIEAKKMELLNSERFSILHGFAPYEKLLEDHKDIDYDSMEVQLKMMHSDFVVSHQESFSAVRRAFGLGVTLNGLSDKPNDNNP